MALLTGLNRFPAVKLLSLVTILSMLVFNGSLSLTREAAALGNINDPTLENYLISEGSFIEKVGQGTSDPKQVTEYEVQEGDNLAIIAEKFNISVTTIKRTNDLSSAIIHAGQKLRIFNIDGVLMVVKEGDTLTSIAKKYDGNEELTLWYNSLSDDAVLHAGDEIFIPGGIHPDDRQRDPVIRESGRGGRTVTPGPNAKSSGGSLAWPIYGAVFMRGMSSSHFGWDLSAPTGTPIYAAESGVVSDVSTGWTGGYGNRIIVDHGNGLQTLYAHMSAFAVSEGQTVNRGDNIGFVGSTGRSTGPHLHFEVLDSGAKVSPGNYLQ